MTDTLDLKCGWEWMNRNLIPLLKLFKIHFDNHCTMEIIQETIETDILVILIVFGIGSRDFVLKGTVL